MSGSDLRTRRWPLVALAVVLLAASAGSLGWGLQQRDTAVEAQQALDQRRDGALAATAFVEALLSYDYQDLDAQRTAVERLATTRFAEEYADAFSGEVSAQIIEEEATSTASVDEVYVTVDDGDELTAVVIAQSEVTSARGATASVESFLRVRLLFVDDRWQVDDLTSLGSRDRTGAVPGLDENPDENPDANPDEIPDEEPGA